jgi:hypothetical protein
MPRKLVEQHDEDRAAVIDRQELDDTLEILKAMHRGEALEKDPKLKEILERSKQRASVRGLATSSSIWDFSVKKILFALIVAVIGFFILMKQREQWKS